MNKKFILIVIASAVISFIAGAGAHYLFMTSYGPHGGFMPKHSPFGHSRPDKERFMKMLTDELKLTQDQADRFRKTFTDKEKELDEYRDKTYKLFGSLEALMIDKEFNEASARKILAEIDSVKMEERLLFMKSRFDAKKFLTPEQSDKLDKIMKNRFSRFKTRFKEKDINPHD